MQFPHIIALIDSRIALLQQVRDLLAPSSAEAQPPTRNKRQEPAARPAEAAEIPAAAHIPEAASLPEPVRLPARKPRTRAVRVKRTSPDEKQTALAAPPPAGPVFVSAERLREEEARRREAEQKTAANQDDKPVEANQILRKWLQEELPHSA